MLNSQLFRAALVVALIMATSPLASAAEIIVNLAPPAPVVETAPRPVPVAPGYWVWRPGFWRWDGRQYVWVRGRYVHPPYYGAVWVPGHWDARPRGWVWVPGHWRRA
ncbi:MAG: YXWGXW repeat-containing protein [Stellaceae bacterium]